MLAVRSANTNCSNGMPMCASTSSNQPWLALDARCRLSAFGRRAASNAFKASSTEAREVRRSASASASSMPERTFRPTEKCEV